MSLVNKDTLHRVELLFTQKLFEMKLRMASEKRADPLNVTGVWNKYLRGLDAVVVRGVRHGGPKVPSDKLILNALIDTVNHHNERLVGSLVIKNPNNPVEFVIIPKSVVEACLALGLP
jgi:hypothetical protein